ncbi:hypothetical protein SAMN05421805_13323 [Saccharopolyspora antimicrobica]|uniref:Uncharacterized protein n=1 Tax=Saccharopolyspora antimicrobica TaxID=455193 RepID=A0A1I5LTU0_9PSEU|nr:hypothetical protein ATL45_5755 [Saccharopolyspora antimicrobica]SFP00690.1 hypothetical protein SAMN05421805_13323 [Saccharopolyspora antimicrobica]
MRSSGGVLPQDRAPLFLTHRFLGPLSWNGPVPAHSDGIGLAIHLSREVRQKSARAIKFRSGRIACSFSFRRHRAGSKRLDSLHAAERVQFQRSASFGSPHRGVSRNLRKSAARPGTPTPVASHRPQMFRQRPRTRSELERASRPASCQDRISTQPSGGLRACSSPRAVGEQAGQGCRRPARRRDRHAADRVRHRRTLPPRRSNSTPFAPMETIFPTLPEFEAALVGAIHPNPRWGTLLRHVESDISPKIVPGPDRRETSIVVSFDIGRALVYRVGDSRAQS